MPTKPFHFFALVGYSNDETEVKRVAVSNALQVQLGNIFEEQAQNMLDDNGISIAYEANYKLDDGERFEVPDFQIPENISTAIKNPEVPPPLNLTQEMGRIKSIFAGYFNHRTDKLEILFQSFSKNRIIRPEFTLLSSSNTFRKLEEPGLVIDSNVAAVFKDDKLYFYSRSITNRFLDLTDLYSEATNEEISEVLQNGNIHVEDLQKVLQDSDSWMRKRFTSIKENGILENVSGKKIAQMGGDFNLVLKLKKVNGKMLIIFPDNKTEQKLTLKLLNEELFKGILTNRNLQTNSYRKM